MLTTALQRWTEDRDVASLRTRLQAALAMLAR
jgi:hypothetical protein